MSQIELLISINIRTEHRILQQVMQGSQVWVVDGKNTEGKVVSNPDTGTGLATTNMPMGQSVSPYQIGLSANKTDISFYIPGIEDKNSCPKHSLPIAAKRP